MSNLVSELLREEKNLSNLISELTKSLKEAPVGNLRISHSKKSTQYYYTENKTKSKRIFENKARGREIPYLKSATDNKGSDQGIYIRKCDKMLAQDIAQRDYDAKLFKILDGRLKLVQDLLKHLHDWELLKIYEKLSPSRKEIVQPRFVTDEEYVRQWNKVQYEGKIFAEGTALIYSNKGERVRSKSEKIIADTLLKNDIPYRYEAPVSLYGIGTVYPDFTVLNIKRRKEVYWEHLGMMDNTEYCEKALRKIELYQQNGIILGKNLIITYETSRCPIETKMIERNISEYCLS